jgi:hypothetical protein
MTDEQYIDDLFAREGIGWDKTPGFRAFVLHLMGIIGERPRAGDVSSMHLAYTAGLEHGKEWTDERPSEAGEYWLSLHPNRRTVAASYPVGLERPVERVWVEGERLKTRMGWSMSLTAGWLNGVELLDGAKWSRRETPADPFEEVVT